MAEIKLNLREPNSKRDTPIRLIIRYNNQKLVYSTGKKIIPKYWDNDKQKIKKAKEFPEADILEKNLSNIVHTVQNELELYLKDKRHSQ